jgi:5-hydroxyisourate hydrolase-like protein (transthyretin family)
LGSSGDTAPRLRIEVVDETSACGAAGMRVDVFTLGARARKLCGGVVNAEGVVDAPVLSSDAIVPGEYEVVFHVGAYFKGREATGDLPFLDTVPFRFALAGTQRFVLPVRVTPCAFALVQPSAGGASVAHRRGFAT